MNYFIYSHPIFELFFPYVCGIAAVIPVGWLLTKIDRKHSINNWIFFLIIIFSFGIGVFFAWNLLSHLKHGRMQKLYVYPHKNTVYLSTLNYMKGGTRRGTSPPKYAFFLETYELPSGKSAGSIYLGNERYSYRFRIFWNGGAKGWVVDYYQKILLLDLSIPAVVATDTEIVQRYPSLGDSLTLPPEPPEYNPIHNWLYVVSPGGKRFALDENLHLLSPTKRESFTHVLYQNKIWRFKKDWSLVPVPKKKTYRVHCGNTPFSGKSKEFIKPRFIPELNLNVREKERIWIMHKSAFFRNVETLLSYVNKSGEEINHISLSQLFDGKPVQALGSYSGDAQSFIIIGVGLYNLLSVEQEFVPLSLYALQVDNRTGEVIKLICYYS